MKPSHLSLGESTRRAVLGNDHVDNAAGTTDGFDGPFQELITESAWGSVWSRKEISKRERSMITIALLASLGHYEEMAMHIRATKRTGATESDVREALLHVAIYAGVPSANNAFRVAKQVFAEMASEKAD
jgi:4-carboxymuconolactone decarboxylase